MEQDNVSEQLINVAALPLSDGTFFHAKRIGLPYFRVPAELVVKDGFELVPASKN